ncbi:MAG TPA: exodeoxyribonuclease VII small subunit [Candidatus Eisenbacteria bacterium]|nr:exodeoxyribonuclease VII small subunit [Candidatus Eisenbacteria bacterium]
MNQEQASSKRFETALEELTQIVEELEAGELSLEDSLAAFEKGVALVQYCHQKLTQVEKKIEVLVRDKNGRLELKPFEPPPEENGDRQD